MVAPARPSPEQLASRLEFEALISDTSARLLAAAPETIESEVERALERVRSFFAADRCGLLSASGDRQMAHVSLLACAEGVPTVSGEINLAQLFPWARRTLLDERREVRVSRMADLPPEADLDRATWAAMGTRANLALPIETGEVIRHVIVIHTVHEEREWPDAIVTRLRLLGEMLVNALERRAMIDGLREAEERVSLATDSAGAGIWSLDLRSGVYWVSERIRAIFGFAPEELVDLERVEAAVHPEDLPLVREAIERALQDRVTRSVEYRLVVGAGGVRWVASHGRAHFGPTGEPERLMGVTIDITERRQAEEALRGALAEVQRLRDLLQRENAYLRQEARRRQGPELIVGRSPATRRATELAAQVAATSSTVLLLGETGVGKERFASFIHGASPRRDRAMIRVSCSAIPTTLIESELFGREKGAYTGALSKQVGRFELAHGSTLFLDEVGELPLEVQVKLLRVLEERTIERLGNPRPVPVDVRILAATHRDLEKAVREGRFREDLYYRLNVFPITVAPLRERREDIPLLVTDLVDELAEAMGKHVDAVDPASLEALVAHDWPGNVRELRNVIERAMILADGPVLRVEVPLAPRTRAPHGAERRDSLESDGANDGAADDLRSVDRAHIQQVLEACGWRVRGVNGAAARLGLKPTTLESRLERLGIRRPGAT